MIKRSVTYIRSKSNKLPNPGAASGSDTASPHAHLFKTQFFDTLFVVKPFMEEPWEII